MIIIGIAGGTGSGKTTVVKNIVDSLPTESVAVIPQDSYYNHQWNVPEELRKLTNFDHPNAFDWPLFEEQIEMLRDGQAIEQPTYSYLTCTRQQETVHVDPKEVISKIEAVTKEDVERVLRETFSQSCSASAVGRDIASLRLL